MTDKSIHFEDLLKNDDYVAIVLKQYLRPVEGEGEPVFPPTYPMPTYRGRVYSVGDGDYRVSVELPPFNPDGSRADKKGEQRQQEAAGYNIDELKGGANICEIDSPQSQANRLEPLFEKIKDGKLVPQIRIKAGRDQEINLLAAGHRAADAVVRFSSLAAELHDAFTEVRRGNHLKLAMLAPTSILFGVWDSRGTQVKLPRILKSEIRATNVEKLTRSAQFNPAIDFAQSEAVDESLDEGEGDKNPLGAEGMKHVPAPRGAGGVVVHGEIRRVARINLAAVRSLNAHRDGQRDEAETERLQGYLLGLAIVAATRPLQMNLREGCLLCAINDEKWKTSVKTVKIDGGEDDYPIDSSAAEEFAEAAAKAFFGEKYDCKDRLDVIFESGVANKFLGMSTDERKKIARGGPITADAIRQFEEKSKDPLKHVLGEIKNALKALAPPPRGGSAPPTVQSEAFNATSERLAALTQDEQVDQPVKDLCLELQQRIAKDRDTRDTLKDIERRIGEFKKRRKDAGAATEPREPASAEQA